VGISTEIDPILYIGGNATGYAEGITIRDLLIDGQELGTTVRGILIGYARHILIDHVYVKGCSRYSLSVLHTPNGSQYAGYLPRHVTVQNSVFEGFSGQQMENVLFGGIGNVFRNNEIFDSPKRALAVYDDTYNRSYGIVVSENYIHDNAKDGIFVHVPSIIENNIICNNAYSGIKVQPNGEQITYEGNVVLPIRGVVVEGNHIYNNTESGISVIDSDGIVIENNVIHNNMKQGILIATSTLHNQNITQHLAGIKIIGNQIFDNGQSGTFDMGIYFDTTINNINITNALISGNLIFNTEKAIRFESGNYSNFRITDNYFNATTVLSKSTDANFSDFHFENNLGFITENSGTATITASTTVTFDHGLAGTPTLVLSNQLGNLRSLLVR